MRTIDDVYFVLLSKFDQLCKDNNLRYYISTKNAMSIYRYNQSDVGVNGFSVYMHVKDFISFINLMSNYKDDNLYFDYISNNHDYFDFYASFGDKKSVDIKLNSIGNFSHKGIHISIKPLKPSYYFKHRTKKIDLYENAWKNSLKEKYYSNLSYPNNKVISKIRKLRDQNKYEELQAWFLKSLFKYYSQKGIYKRYSAELNQRKEYFKNPDNISYRGKQFYTMTNLKDFFYNKYGKDWKGFNYQKNPSQYRIVSTDIAYNEFIKNINFNEIQEILEKRLLYIRDRRQYQKVFNNMFSIFKRSYYRIKFYDYFKDNMEDINMLIEQKKFDQLKDYFHDYHKKVIYFKKRNLSLYINNDIQRKYYQYLKSRNLGYLIISINRLLKHDNNLKELK